MRRMLSAILTVLILVPAGAGAQVSSTPLRDAAHREAVRFAKALPPPAATQPAPRRNWVARHPILTGTLVGTGIGLGFLAAEGCYSADYGCPGLVGFYGGTGAAIGAAGGVVLALILH
jgi:hypothetical protein